MLAYVWLLGFPMPATRSAAMLALLDIAKLRQRIVAPRGTIGLAALLVMLVDPWSVQSVGAWLSVAAVTAVIWAGRAAERHPKIVRLLAPWSVSFAALQRLSDCECLAVHFLDVGQGDAIALRTPAGRWLLIDGGPRGPPPLGDAGRRVVVPFLRSHGATQLAVIVATHAHLDHFGG